jgi:hypothetical protein
MARALALELSHVRSLKCLPCQFLLTMCACFVHHEALLAFLRLRAGTHCPWQNVFEAGRDCSFATGSCVVRPVLWHRCSLPQLDLPPSCLNLRGICECWPRICRVWYDQVTTESHGGSRTTAARPGFLCPAALCWCTSEYTARCFASSLLRNSRVRVLRDFHHQIRTGGHPRRCNYLNSGMIQAREVWNICGDGMLVGASARFMHLHLRHVGFTTACEQRWQMESTNRTNRAHIRITSMY